MKIIVLTTETVHHAYFVQQIQKDYPIEKVIIEQTSVAAPFATEHPFERERDQYERDIFFGGKTPIISDFASVSVVDSVNGKSSENIIREISPDIMIDFGTGRVRQNIIDLCPDNFLNLHGGDPEEYRGLDTQLWAIYHKDFMQLYVTLHKLNIFLDDGEIVFKKRIELTPEMEIYQIRRFNTEISVELVRKALEMFQEKRCLTSVPQRKKGRYYSFMPRELKSICVRHMNDYRRRLVCR